MATKQPTNQPTNQLIFIVGPTATGKTDLAFALAKELHADILSADSRQVYKGLEITSGLDVPEGWFPTIDEGPYYFFNENTRLYGVDFLSFTDEWSISHFRELAEQVLVKTKERRKRLIIVGGSGLYHQSLFLNKQILNIRPSDELREQLSRNSVAQLQQLLREQLSNAAELLNHSDWNNPRRLIRWIEKTQMPNTLVEQPSVFSVEEDHMWIGLKPDIDQLENKIHERVVFRIHTGAIQEVEQLLSADKPQKLPAFSTLGVKDLALFIQDQITKEELIQLWTKHELQYVKRQMTWFKKRQYIHWLKPSLSVEHRIAEVKKQLEGS